LVRSFFILESSILSVYSLPDEHNIIERVVEHSDADSNHHIIVPMRIKNGCFIQSAYQVFSA
jgi:hypothetical protein